MTTIEASIQATGTWLMPNGEDPVRTQTRFLLAAVATCAAHTTEAQEARFTDLVGPTCQFKRDTSRIGDLKRCRGHGGARPETLAEETRTHFALRFEPSRPQPLISAWSFGSKLEWRGWVLTEGFQPHSVLVRALLKDPESPKSTADGQVLAIIRVAPAEPRACVVAVLDASRRDANAIAGKAADRIAPAFRCGLDRAVVIGPRTRWTAAVLGAGS